MANVFQKYPIILDLVEGSDLRSRYVFIGDVPEKVATAVKKASQSGSNEILSKFYGPKWKIIIGLEEEKHTGGDLDIFDISDIIPGKEKKTEVKVLEVHPENKYVVVEDVHIYPEDRISEFKEKISIVIPNLPLFKQHLYVENRGPVYYRIISDIVSNVDIERAAVGKTKLLDLPIDSELYQTKDHIQIEALDYFTTMGDIYTKWNARHLKVVSLDYFISGKEKQIEEVMRSDTYQFDMIYYSFILKFWPMLTYDVFKLYISEPNELRSTYPDLSPNIDMLRKKYEKERELLDNKYKLLGEAPASFQKYAPEQAYLSEGKVGSKQKIIDISIKSAVLTMEKELQWKIFDLSAYIKVNIKNLFEELHANEAIPFIRASISTSANGSVILTKIKSPHLVEGQLNDIPRIFEKIKYRIQLPYINTLLIVIPVLQEDLYLILTIHENGKYQVRSSWGEEIQIDFMKMYSLIEKSVNPIIQIINSLGRGVFDSMNRLPLVSKTTSEFSGLYLSLFWKSPLSSPQFRELGELLKLDSSSDIIKNSSEVSDAGTFVYQMNKGMVHYNFSDMEQNIYAHNYYEYLTNSKIKQKWTQLFGEGRTMKFIHRATDVKVEIQDLKENEFRYFYEYVISLFYRFENEKKEKKTLLTPNKPEGKKTNRLKILKSKDPELYVFKKFGSDVVYSRICQKEHQPLLYDESEYANLEASIKNKAVKFWNYTTSQPAYYVCPNPKFPYLNFLVGQHPRGYCLPCCKKTPASEAGDEKYFSKKDHVYNTCMQQHTYTEEDVKGGPSRYIMNYGKPVDVGRIGNLPDIIGKYLLYNLADKDTLTEEQIPKVFYDNSRQYSVHHLLKITRHSKVKDIPLSEMTRFLEKKIKEYNISDSESTVLQILEDPQLSPSDYNKISNADVARPILFLRDREELKLIEGIYRLAKAKLVGDENIHAKIITRHQLEKAVLDKPLVGGGTKKLGHYLYGVSQNNSSVSNVGAGYSIASSLNMSFPEFIEKIISYFRNYSGSLDYFKIIYRGELNSFFSTLDDMLTQMFELFVEENVKLGIGGGFLKKFPGWNELFIELVEICFNKKVLLLDDTSIDVAGTSTKSTKATENIEFIIPNIPSSLDTITIENMIPDSEHAGVNEYIILLRKRKKAKTLFNSNYVYYPIFVFVPQLFFKNRRVEKKVYTHKDEIIQLLRKVLLEVVSKNSTTILSAINLFTVQRYVSKSTVSAVIEKYYMNNRNTCYAVGISFQSHKGRKYTIWPIQFSRNADKKLQSFSNYNRTDITASFMDTKVLYDDYNKFVVQISEEEGAYQVAPEESEYSSPWNQREKTILPVVPLIKVEKFLAYEDKIIGFVSKGLYHYFKPTSIKPADYVELLAGAMKNHSILVEGFKKLPTRYSIFYLLYDPDEINANLNKKSEKEDLSKINKALYKRYIYNIFVSEFISSLDSERDNKMRDNLYKEIEYTNFKKISELEKFYSNLQEMLKGFPNDLHRIKQYINQIIEDDFSKRKVLSDIQADIFEFDRKTLRHLEQLSHDKDQKNLEIELAKHTSGFIQLESGHSKEIASKIFPNVFVPCIFGAENPYCNKKKLVVIKHDYKILLELMVSDLLNPLKREYLFSSIILNNTKDNFRFTRKKGEEIYIKYNE
jgi:hypothetical protein